MTDWYVDPIGGSINYSGDSWTVDLSGTDGQTYGTTKFTSASGGFTGMEGRYIRVVATARLIVTVVSDTEVTLDNTYTTGTARNFWIGGPVQLPQQVPATLAAPTDRMKFPKTPDPVSAGNLTWTDQNTAVTFASGRVKLIDDCESGWQQPVNTTVTHQATGAICGTNSMKVQPASAFTTGKLTYKDLGAGNELDLSSFQGISCYLYIATSAVSTAGALRICLCSDASGDTIVDEIEIQPYGLYYGYSVPVQGFRTGGGNLGSGIRSLALYIDVDSGSPTIYLDNIVAIKSVSDSSHLCHRCVIAQGDEISDMWWGIKNFSGDTTLNLSNEWYAGTMGTAGEQASYRREMVPMQKTLNIQFNFGQNNLTRVEMSGGWNTSTDTQDGETCWFPWASASGDSDFLYFTQSYGYKLRRFIFCGQIRIAGAYLDNTTFEDCAFTQRVYHSAMQMIDFDVSSYSSLAFSELVEFRRCRFAGVNGTPIATEHSGLGDTYRDGDYGWLFEDVKIYSTRGLTFESAIGLKMVDVEIMNSCGATSYHGLYFPEGAKDIELRNVTIKDNDGYAISTLYWAFSMRAWNLVTSGNALGTFNLYATDLKLFNADLAEGTKFSNLTRAGRVVSVKEGGVAGAHTITTSLGTISADGSTRHTASGVSWRFNPTDAKQFPLGMKIASVVLEQGVSTTLGVWMRRDNTAIAGRLYVPKGQLAGLTTDAEDSITANADVWDLVQVTLQASETGVVEVYAEAVGGTAYSLWVDDLSVTA